MNYQEYIKKQIDQNNPWYTDSQFEWAERKSIRRIYFQRSQFFLKIIIKEVKKKRLLTILDYGCGDGYWSLFFSKIPFCKVTGVDYNKLRIKRAEGLVKDVEFIEADLREKNDNLGKYDIVFCSQVIEHVKDDIAFLFNIQNHLKSNGLLVLGTPNEGSLTHRIRNYLKKIHTDHYHFYTEKEVKSKLEKTGFQILDIFHEIFYPSNDNLYYRLAATSLGFKILQFFALLIPSQCSDFYFECKLR